MSSPQSYDANDVLFGGGIPAAKFESPGDTFAGPITKLEASQARKFKDGKPTDELDTWPNGDPKMVAVATLKTAHRDPSDPSDDGQRKLYIASRDMQAKVREAVRLAGQRKLDIGGVLQVTYTGDVKTDSGLYAKVYEVSYNAPSAAAANQALGVGAQAMANVAAAHAPQAQVPTVQQLIPQADPTAVQVTSAAPAATNLDNLPPEARAMVERMLAGQQQG
jgi:hypothetical protein